MNAQSRYVLSVSTFTLSPEVTRPMTVEEAFDDANAGMSLLLYMTASPAVT